MFIIKVFKSLSKNCNHETVSTAARCASKKDYRIVINLSPPTHSDFDRARGYRS